MSIEFTADRPLLLVGCGNMGGALFRGWIAAGISPKAIRVIEPSGVDRPVAYGAEPANVFTEVPQGGPVPRAILMAVKPQMMGKVLPTLRPLIGEDTLVISVAAGTTLKRMEELTGGHPRLIRAMPNTPAAVGRGATVIVARPEVTPDERALTKNLLSAVGSAYEVEEEALIDAVTALSGSGPAYVFHLMECMAAAGAKLGLPPALALDLARDTVAGAGELAKRSQDDPSTLRVQVTSPNGTTAAGLSILMSEQGLAPLIQATLTAAYNRSRELGQDT
ncbi:pyrroline-5-carboxylate reductase [Pedomonas mirosovicensis]|uniref:pyrroline-5-carboxylate reductase n=1 Tax=Pedomonas mirosovicensis TaxID=2908641 RepID=UPI002168F408|nr:pyrroline-5-carboxylate reductase [Pedomonas mirosovicensis]MCH8685448.1 pyrroline-5-carboxylate reductase [Pedomonas mirosovicensis]